MAFEMNDVERQRADEWRLKHNEEKHAGDSPYAGACGGSLTYEFTPTGLGVAVWVRCMCGEKGECTDFDLWG